MAERPFQLIKGIAALLLVVTLGACVGSTGEPFAPELRKRYVLTEDLVLTSYVANLPRHSLEVPFVMTHEERIRLKSIHEGTYALPNLGSVLKENQARVTRVFTYSDFHGTTRYGKLHLTDLATGEQLIAYGRWKYVGPKLREVGE